MAVIRTYPFTTVTNYTYDDTKIVIENGEAKLLDLGGGTYDTSDPSIVFNEALTLEALDLFTETSTKTGLDEIKYILTKDGIDYYFTTVWEVSDGTYAQANTAAEIETNKATFTVTGITTTIKMFLHSNDGTTTPSIDTLSLTYDFAPGTQDEIHTTILWWWGVQNDATDDTATGTITLTNESVKYATSTRVSKETVTITPTAGLYEVNILDTESMALDSSSKEQTYTLTIGSKVYKLNIPKLDAVNLYDTGVIVG